MRLEWIVAFAFLPTQPQQVLEPLAFEAHKDHSPHNNHGCGSTPGYLCQLHERFEIAGYVTIGKGNPMVQKKLFCSATLGSAGSRIERDPLFHLSLLRPPFFLPQTFPVAHGP